MNMPKSFKEIQDAILLAESNVNAGNSPWQCNRIIGWREFFVECKKTFDLLSAQALEDDSKFVKNPQAMHELTTLSRFMGAAMCVILSPVESDDDRFRESREMKVFKYMLS